MVKKNLPQLGYTKRQAIKALVESGRVTKSTAYRFFNGETIMSDSLEVLLDFFGLWEGILRVKTTEEGDLIIEKKDLEGRPWLESLRPAIRAADEELELHILEAAAANLRRKLEKKGPGSE